jgi:hypothetical protein
MTGPTMDDEAASQQLIDEGARAEHAGGADSISEDGQQVLSLPSTPDADPSQQTLPSSMPSAALKRSRDNEKALRNEPVPPPIADESASLTPRRIEVPDSQLAPAPSRLSNSPSATTAQSSFAVPASAQEGSTPKSTYKKGKKRIRAEVDPNNILPEQHTSNDQEDTFVGAADTSPQKKRRRSRKTYATPPATETGSEQATVTSEQDNSTSLSAAHVVEGLTSSRKRKNLARKSPGRKPPSDSVEDDVVAAGDEPIVGRKSLIKRLKKAKPSRSTKKPTTPESESEPLDEAPKMDLVNLNVNQTPVETSSAEAERLEAAASPLVPKKPRSTRKKPDYEVPTAQTCPDATQNDIDPVEDQVSNVSPSKNTPKQKRKLKPKRAPSGTPQRSYARKSRLDISKAERELNTFRDLRFDSELPTSGDFTDDENELLRRAVRDYHQRKGLDTESLVSIIQWADPSCDPVNARPRKDWAEQDFEYEEESKEFWDEVTNTQPILKRTREIIKRHVQAQFSTHKSGAWTEDEDKQLKKLVEAYPKKWKIISLSMGNRSAHDCLNRWKDYVQFGDSRNNGTWTAKEEALLLDALSTFIQRDEEQRDAANLPSLAEYSTADIKWSEILKLMGFVRNRPQCTAKWTAMKEKGDASAMIRPNYRRGRTPDPNRIVEPTPKKRKAEPTPKKTKAPRKSNAHTGSGDDNEVGDSTKRRRKSRKSETGGDDTKKRRQSKRSQEVAANTAHNEGIEEEIPETPRQERNAATPRSEQPRSVLQTPKTPTLEVAQMRWGDKFDLLEAIATDTPRVTEEDIDWQHISTSMQNNWSVRVLQAALKELLTLVPEQETFIFTVLAAMEYLVLEIDHDELKEHYDPFDVDVLGEEDGTSIKVSESARKSMPFVTGSDSGESEEEL